MSYFITHLHPLTKEALDEHLLSLSIRSLHRAVGKIINGVSRLIPKPDFILHCVSILGYAIDRNNVLMLEALTQRIGSLPYSIFKHSLNPRVLIQTAIISKASYDTFLYCFTYFSRHPTLSDAHYTLDTNSIFDWLVLGRRLKSVDIDQKEAFVCSLRIKRDQTLVFCKNPPHKDIQSDESLYPKHVYTTTERGTTCVKILNL